MHIATTIAALALVWGASNRGRGWGPRTGAPAWQVWVSKHLLSRDTMAAVHGFTAYLAAWAWGAGYWQAGAIGLATALGWRIAVTPGWGEYQDGQRIDNKERPVIDWLVVQLRAGMVALAEWLLWSKKPRRMAAANWLYTLSTNARFVDAVSMGLRGVWYVPMFVACGVITQSWWFALPAGLFWQAGLVYAPLYGSGMRDYVRVAEWVDDTVRGALYFVALALALQAF